MKKILAYIVTAVLLLSVLPMQVFAENMYSYSVDLEGECNYDYAKEMVALLNEHRIELGLSELALDKELTDAAMKRALELAVNFDHVRPDGSSCFTICSKMNAENIAVGRSTAKDTFEQFKNSAPHYKKMINASYRSVGIGSIYHNGHYYWVQLFSMTPTNMMETTDGIVPLKHNVKVAEDEILLKLYIGNYLSSDRVMEMSVGKSYQMTVERFNPGFQYFTSSIAPSSFTWVSSDPNVISVDENGMMSAVGVGSATVTASVVEGNITLSQKFSVPGSMSDVTAVEMPDVIFNGSEATPEPVLTLNGSTLVKDKDYTLSYSSNDEIGTATVTVTGIGFMKGTMELNFNIIAPDLSDEDMTEVTLPESISYTGSEIMPEPVIIVDGKKLVKDVDYTLSYSENTAVGTAYVTVTGMGIYSGTSRTVSFEIAPLEVSQSVNAKINANAVFSDETYPDRQTFVQDNVSVSYKGTQLVNGEDYRITYSSLTSEKKLSTISSAFIPEIKDCYFTGEDIVPEITVYKSELDKFYGGEPLKAGVDYYLNFTGNQYPGIAEVTVIGTGKYFGESTAQFKIIRVKKGDVDRNNTINMRDVSSLQRYINGWNIDIDLYAADTDFNSQVNMKDYAVLQRYVNGWNIILNPEDESSSESESDSESQGDPDSESQGDSDSESQGDPDSESQGDPDSESQGDPDSESQGDSDSESQGDPDSESQGDPDSESEADSDSESQGDTGGESGSGSGDGDSGGGDDDPGTGGDTGGSGGNDNPPAPGPSGGDEGSGESGKDPDEDPDSGNKE